MYWLLTILALAALGASAAAGVFMSGLTGEPIGRTAAKSAAILGVVLVALYLFQ